MAKKNATASVEKTAEKAATPAKAVKSAKAPVTIADLKASIDSEKMGIPYNSKSKKGDLETAITEWRNANKKPAKAGRTFRGEH